MIIRTGNISEDVIRIVTVGGGVKAVLVLRMGGFTQGSVIVEFGGGS